MDTLTSKGPLMDTLSVVLVYIYIYIVSVLMGDVDGFRCVPVRATPGVRDVMGAVPRREVVNRPIGRSECSSYTSNVSHLD